MTPNGHPWSIGDRVRFLSFDSDDADARELDGMQATVIAIDEDRDLVRVESIYGQVWYDPYGFEAA